MTTVGRYSFDEAILKLEAYCAYQERCTREVYDKAIGWGFDHDKIEELITHLKTNGFLNDVRFAEAFVSGKVSIKKWGRIKIRMALRVKGIPSDLINASIDTINDEMYLKNLFGLTERKAETVRSTDEFEIRIKTSRYLMSKGYEGDLVKDALDAYFNSRRSF